MSNSSATPLPLELPYGYYPTKWICALYVALFGLSSLIHLGQLVWFRAWWLLPTAVFCGLLEVIGWSGRLWSSINPWLDTPHLMQIVTTIIAPTPLVAANFIILGCIITRLGSRYSRLSAKWYTILFLTCDIVALVVQAAGGAIASSADTPSGARNGANIMLGGIVFQLVAIVAYATLATEFLIRYIQDRPVYGRLVASRREVTDPRLKLLLLGLSFLTLLIFIRSVYRTIELSDGWHGRIIQTEVYFDVLDGAMITLAMFTMNFCHPGYLLREGAGKLTAVEDGQQTPVNNTTMDILEPKFQTSRFRFFK
ncbi:RTA1-domain-containing protein [Artomyces pyxidatus]|uniref:RTA1-domain-containing protein n=1 Tax=Artomyces pyxidatus TaxID=48021 RepID=A0ACB8SS96_9AGAM|nr:RTA1-domain-containing protein [Artomyces pyxidatus]